jgi:hypothetical protein
VVFSRMSRNDKSCPGSQQQHGSLGLTITVLRNQGGAIMPVDFAIGPPAFRLPHHKASPKVPNFRGLDLHVLGSASQHWRF